MYITTYTSPKTANETTSKSTPLMNTLLLFSLLHCCFELNCGLNADCIVNIVAINTDGTIVGIYRNDDTVDIDRDEESITETKNQDITRPYIKK